MLANEKKVDSDGKEVMLFPCEAMYLTPSRNPPEHDVLALDFLPRSIAGTAISPMNVYAPFSGTIVYTGNDHNCILESDDVVHTPSGLQKMRVLVAHSWTQPIKNQHYNQGDLFYQTGNYGYSFGEHLHMEIAIASGSYWNPGGTGLNNAIHMWLGMYVDNTALLRTGDFNWQTFGDTPTPTPVENKKNNFKWVLYAKKIRNKSRI